MYSGTAVFFKYLLDDEEAYLQPNSVSASSTQDEKYLNHFGPFTVISLYYLRTLATSHLFAALALRNLPTNSKGCVFHGTTLLNKSRFHLCYVLPRHQDRSYKKFFDPEKLKMKSFFEDNFNTLLPEEKDSVSKSFDRSHTLYIIGFENGGTVYHVIAVIMYVSMPDGSYINWFAVSSLKNDKKRFGRFANEKPF